MATRVLVVDDDHAVRDVIATALRDAGYDCVQARNGDEGLRLARLLDPAVILLDVLMPGRNGDEVHEALRADQRTRYIPVIFVTGQGRTREVALRRLRGADDHIAKPFDLEELVARVSAVQRRARELRALNPLSGLPGNRAIAEEIGRHLSGDDGWACVYCDLDHFKEFNDHYGFARGDELIVRVATLLLAAAEKHRGAFVGHVGGDDFVILLPEEDAPDLARAVVRDFDALAPSVYDAEDRTHGGIVRVDRQGVERMLPFVTVSLGIVSMTPARFADSIAVSRAAAEVKEIAKRREASSWAIDRRRAQDAAVTGTVTGA